MDMSRNPDDEIEQIEQGLAAFLEQETAGFPAPAPEPAVVRADEGTERKRQELRTDMLGPEPPRASRSREAGPQISPQSSGHRSQPPQSSGHRSRPGGSRPEEPPRRVSRDESPRRRPAQERRREDGYESARTRKRAREYEEDYDEEREPFYEEEPEELPRRRRGRRRRKSLLKRLLLFVLIFCAAVGGLWYYVVGRVYAKMHYEEVASLVTEPFKEDGVMNVLLIGNDSRTQGEDGRSDAMILLSISQKTKTIHMMSLLRDMYVDIPGHEGNRLNAAYAFGGPELLLETLEENLGLEVNRYVLVNFQAFAGLVDAVGGVDLELSNEEVQYVNGYLTEYNNLEGRPEGTDYLDSTLSGDLHLNGPQALAYCRIRYIGTDFGRTQRQREVLSAVIKQAPKAVLTNPAGLMEGLLPNLTTNLTEAECRQLSLQVLSLMSYEIVQSSIPIQGSYQNASIRGMSVLEVDFAANKAYIRENIYGK